jgi:uncharacterized membrane protein
LVSLQGCGDKIDPVTSCRNLEFGPLSYELDIAPLLGLSCLSCHSVNRTASDRFFAPPNVDFDTKDDIETFIDRILPKVLEGTMPPVDGRIGYEGVVQNNIPALTDIERCAFAAWVEQGFPP